MSIDEMQTIVSEMVRDQGKVIKPEALARAIGVAVLRFGMDKPDRQRRVLEWGAMGQECALPWWEALWQFESLEYPIGQTPVQTVFGTIRQDGADWVLRLVQALPSGAQTIITFVRPWTLTDTGSTIASGDIEAVASYAAHLLCRQLASHFSGQRETVVAADISQQDSRARAFAERAKEYRAMYFAGVGKPDPALATAGAAGGSGQASASATATWPRRRPNHNLVQRGVL